MMKTLLVLAPAVAAEITINAAVELVAVSSNFGGVCTEGALINGKNTTTACFECPSRKITMVCPLSAAAGSSMTVEVLSPVRAFCSYPGMVYSPTKEICEVAELVSGASAEKVVESCLQGIETTEVTAFVTKAFPTPAGSIAEAGVGVIGNFVASNVWELITTGKAFTQKDFEKLFDCSVPKAAFAFVVGKAVATVVGGITNPLFLIAEAAGVAVAKNEFGIAIGCNKASFPYDKDVSKTNSINSANTICGGVAADPTMKGLDSSIQTAQIASKVNILANQAGGLTNSSDVAAAVTGGATAALTPSS